MSAEDLVESTRRLIAEVEAMPDDAPHRAEVLDVLRDGLAAEELTAAEQRGDVEPEE